MLSPQPQITEQFLSCVFDPGELFEIRALDCKRTRSFSASGKEDSIMAGIYMDARIAALDAAEMASDYSGKLYYALSPISRESEYARATPTNGYRATHRTLDQHDVAYRKHFLIDLDPIYGEEGRASTKEERLETLRAAERIRTCLCDRGWHPPIAVSSGNGCQLVYRLDGSEISDRAVNAALRYLATEVADLQAKVDPVVSNLSRIARLPGTPNRKGAHTPERPHRLARLIDSPDTLFPNPAAQVIELARLIGYDESATAPLADLLGEFDDDDIAQLFRDYPNELQWDRTLRRPDCTIYYLQTCPAIGRKHTEHTPTSTSLSLKDGRIYFRCHASDCAAITLSRLLQRLTERTGRKPTNLGLLQYQPPDVSKYDALWGETDTEDETVYVAPPVRPEPKPAAAPLADMPVMPRLWIDVETFSLVDISVGAEQHLTHPSAEVTLLSYAHNDGPVTTVDLTSGDQLSEQLITDIKSPSWQKVAWNAGFEIQALQHCLGIHSPVEQWFDPVALGRYLNLAVNDFGLGAVGKVLEMPEDLAKQKDGKQLVKLFACLQNRTKKQIKDGADATFRATCQTQPHEWQRFKEYNSQDVIAMREATHCMEAISRFPSYENEVWCADYKINRVGIPLDLDFLNNAKRIMDQEDAVVRQQIQEVTGVANPNSPPQLKAWLEVQGFPMKSMDEEHIGDALAMDENEIPADARKLLLLRQRQSGSGPKKIPTMLKAATADDRLRGQLVYYGTLNGRFAGRQSQPHNLPRCSKALESRVDELTELIRTGQPLPTDLDVVDVITSLLRSSFRAPEDMVFPICDYSQIESRTLGWLTECVGLNHVFDQGLDLYKVFAAEFYGVPYDSVTKQQRNDSKAPALGCGYGLRPLGLMAQAKKQYGVIISGEVAQKQIDSYARQFPEVPLFWNRLETAAKTAITRNIRIALKCLILDGTNPYGLRIMLPSGRSLFYPSARVVHEDGYERSMIEYKFGKGWTRVYGSLLTAHVNSAMARDLLVFALLECQREGLTVAWHVHDEAICLSRVELAEADRAKLEDVMSRVPPFLEGLVLHSRAEIRKFWRKD